MLTYQQKRLARSIIKTLEFSQGGTIILIACSGEKIQQEVSNKIKSGLGQEYKFTSITLAEDNTIKNFLESQTIGQNNQIFFLYDLPELLNIEKQSHPEEVPYSLQYLNFNRENFREKCLKCVLFIDEPILKDLPRIATDFWAFRNMTAVFTADEDRQKAIGEKLKGYVSEEQKYETKIKRSLDLLKKFEHKQEESADVVDIMLDLAWALYNAGKRKESFDYSNKALTISQKIKYKNGEGRAFNNLGLVYDTWGMCDKALEYYEQGLKVKGFQKKIDLLHHMGWAYQALGKYDKALDCYEQSLKMSSEIGESQEIGNSLRYIGTTNMKLCRFDKALKYFEQSLNIHHKIGYLHGVSRSLHRIGAVFYVWGRYDEAIENYKQSLKIQREIGFRQGESITLRKTGEVYMAIGEYKKAMVYYEQSHKINSEISYRQGEGRTLNSIGMIFCNWDMYDKALTYYKQSLEISRETKDSWGESQTLNSLGELYLVWDKHDLALEYFELSLKISREIRYRQEEGITLGNIGKVYAAQEELDKASDYYQQALEISQDIGYLKGEAEQLRNIGLLNKKKDKPDMALPYLNEALEIFTEIGIKHEADKVNKEIESLTVS